MFFTGVWELPTAKNAGLPFDAQPIPTLFGTPAAYADSHAFTLPHQSSPDEEQRRATYQFVSDILKNSLGVGRGRAHPGVPAGRAERRVPGAGAAGALRDRPPRSSTTTRRPGSRGSGSDFQNYFAETVQNVYLDGDDPAEGFRRLRRRVNVLLSKPNPV